MVHDPQGLGVLGGDDDAAGVPVNAVAQGGGKGVLLVGAPLLFLVEVGLDVGDEGVDPLPLVGVDHQPRPFVDQEQVLILIEDVQLGLEHRQEGVLRGGGVEKLVVDVKLEQVPLGQTGVPLGPLAVELDPLDADVFLGQRGREKGEGFGQPPVQPLAGVIGAHGEFPHGTTTFLGIFLLTMRPNGCILLL